MNALITGMGLAVPGLREPRDLLVLPDVCPEGGFDPGPGLQGRALRHKDRASRLALRAAEYGLADARLLTDGQYIGPARATAVVVSTNYGNLDSVCAFTDTITRDGVAGLSPLGLPHTSSNVIAGWVAICYGLRGPNLTVCNGPTSGLDALYWAHNLIAAQRASIVVVLGVEPDTAPVARLMAELGQQSWLDGAVAVVLESASHARARGAAARAVLTGYARAADLPSAIRAARRDDNQPVGLSLGVPGAATLDLTERLGECSGALGVLQCAAGAAWLQERGTSAVLAACEGEDGAAALLLTAGGAQ